MFSSGLFVFLLAQLCTNSQFSHYSVEKWFIDQGRNNKIIVVIGMTLL